MPVENELLNKTTNRMPPSGQRDNTMSQENNTDQSAVERFFRGYASLDLPLLASSLHPEYRFSDGGFPDLNRKRGEAMWAMFILNHKNNEINCTTHQIHEGKDKDHPSADYVVKYKFEGRPVENHIHSEFELKDGLIYRHVDSFDFYAWTIQTKGLVGRLLGWTQFFQSKVQSIGGAKLDHFISEHPEYQETTPTTTEK
ncbi:hypothetical protein PROFUN_09356 [Planoprotostelium fungivorum]|uniref:SnoaL-like domain-containing protein n=1 Tax=Planoprotostelium fungivorum TaxID=1890364 RepID=A0A2P6NGY3_9EUKA|nr:hypothetical protein PROFUN_09356 [Planoprotostelium fungivorum]